MRFGVTYAALLLNAALTMEVFLLTKNLLIPWQEGARWFFDTLVDAGRQFGMRHAGYHALNSLRTEKGYRHWGHDISPDENPIEAGLGFVVALDKPGGFIGRDAVVKAKEQGVHQRLVQFAMHDNSKLLYHNEPIWRNGELVGRLTAYRDIHVEVEAQDALAASERLFRMLAENATDVVAHADEGLLAWVSPSVTAALGWEPAEMIGKSLVAYAHPSDVSAVAEQQQEADHLGPNPQPQLRQQARCRQAQFRRARCRPATRATRPTPESPGPSGASPGRSLRHRLASSPGSHACRPGKHFPT